MTSRHTPGNRPLISRWVVGGAAVGWMTAAACGVWYEVGERQRHHVAAGLAERAQEARGPSLRATLSDLEQLGVAGIDPLMALAASQRQDLATSSQRTIDRVLAAWEAQATEQGDVEAFAEQVVALASALDAHGGRFGAQGQRWANKLAQRLALHSDQFAAAASWEILACCDHVLSRPLLPQEKTISPRSATALVPPPPLAAKAMPLAPPVVVSSQPAPPRVEANPATVQRRPRADVAIVPPTLSGRRATDGASSNDNALRPPLRLPEQEERMPAVGSGEVIDVPSPQEVRLQARAMRELSDRSLVAKADDRSTQVAASARKALRGRGFSERALQVVGRLEAMAPGERRESLDQAVQLPPADARQVLRWFVADEDPQVRLRALTILATTGDPKLAELARERAVEDDDPRVAAFASELMKTR